MKVSGADKCQALFNVEGLHKVVNDSSRFHFDLHIWKI